MVTDFKIGDIVKGKTWGRFVIFEEYIGSNPQPCYRIGGCRGKDFALFNDKFETKEKLLHWINNNRTIIGNLNDKFFTEEKLEETQDISVWGFKR